MGTLHFRHHNHCPRCPVIGAEDIPGEEFFELRSLRFNLEVARELCRPLMMHRVDHSALREWWIMSISPRVTSGTFQRASVLVSWRVFRI
jgi:hypothetical protein